MESNIFLKQNLSKSEKKPMLIFFKSSSQLAKEPNAINVRLDQKSQEQIPYEIYSVTPPEGMLGITVSNFLQNIISNHSDIKNEQTVEVIKKAMEERRK